MLLAAIDPDPSELPALATALAARLAWDWILGRARSHKVAALLAARLGDLEDAIPLPDRVREPLGRAGASTLSPRPSASRFLDQRSFPKVLARRGAALPTESAHGTPLGPAGYRDALFRHAGTLRATMHCQRLPDEILRSARR